MTKIGSRDNSYWLNRLEKDGHGDLLAQIAAREITVYKARQIAGYLNKTPRPAAAKLSYHWDRASHAERKRFVLAHFKDVNRVFLEIAGDLRKEKAKKLNE
jgi:hypothetical protein